MSEMAEKKPLKAPKYRRFDLWIGYKEDGLTNAEAAAQMGISERQLQRHINIWKEDGTLDNYYLSEWVITKAALRDNEELKTVFQELTKLILKRMKERQELEVKGQPRFIVEVVDNVKYSKQESNVPTSSDTTNSA